MGLSGFAGGNFAEVLQQLMAQAAMRQKLAQDQRMDEEQLGLQRQEMGRRAAGDEEDRALRRQQADRQAAGDRADANKTGVRRMIGELVRREGLTPETKQQAIGLSAEAGDAIPLEAFDAPKAPPPEPLVTRTVRGPNNTRQIRGLTRRDLEEGRFEEFSEPPAPKGSTEQEWVIRGGKKVPIPKGTAREGDEPYDPVAARQQPKDEASPYATERATRTVQSVDELLKKVNRWTTGMGSVLSVVPESDARNFAAELDTLKANIAFNELTQMREASKTGGALGQVSNIELGLLQSALGALDAGQSPANLRTQLKKIRDSVERWQRASGGAAPSLRPMSSHGTVLRFDAQGNPIRD